MFIMVKYQLPFLGRDHEVPCAFVLLTSICVCRHKGLNSFLSSFMTIHFKSLVLHSPGRPRTDYAEQAALECTGALRPMCLSLPRLRVRATMRGVKSLLKN